MQKEKSKSLSGPNENEIRNYFKSHGCTVTRLKDKGKKADFRICNNDSSFLCEAKSIKSVHSNLPFNPSDDDCREQRQNQQKDIKRLAEENSDCRLIMTSDQRDHIFGDEDEYIRRIRRRGVHTEYWFNDSAEKIKKCLENSDIKELPFNLRLDSSLIYVPNEAERKLFIEWLKSEIQAIHNGRPSRCWRVEKSVPRYSTFYRIHKPVDKNDSRAEYQLTLTGLPANSKLQVEVQPYGGLNLESIDGAMQDGLEQLQASASREKDPQIPRIIALAFESSIGFDCKELSSHFTDFFNNHRNISAIAVLDWISDGVPPPQTDGFVARAVFGLKTPPVLRFIIYHNPCLQNVKPLPVHWFSDKWSVQLRWNGDKWLVLK